jgi:hypothetical protein
MVGVPNITDQQSFGTKAAEEWVLGLNGLTQKWEWP